MSFPSDSENGFKRKYICFVCNKPFTDFNEFKTHIIDNHEEGREYVICPLQRCGAPVRDVRAHYKVKHPSEKFPQKGMTKAIIWKDFSGNTKKTKKPQFREGWYESSKMKKNFHYRSGYECTVYECLDEWTDVVGYDAEPFEIPYVHEGKLHKYTPDIFVAFIDGRKELWEIKPKTQKALRMNQDKWDAAEKACQARGWKFAVITEDEIAALKKIVYIRRKL